MSRESVPISSLRKLERPAGYPNGRVRQPDEPVPSQAADPAGASLARKIRQQLPLRELFAAVAMDSLEGARRAIGQGADPNAIVGVEQRFPLASAVLANRSAMVRLLLRAGADPSQRDAAGRTPLIMSASVGSAEIAKALLACGAAVDAYDHQGTTALMEAARNRHGELVRLLIRHGGLPDRQ